jgi:hypothetical protein
MKPLCRAERRNAGSPECFRGSAFLKAGVIVRWIGRAMPVIESASTRKKCKIACALFFVWNMLQSNFFQPKPPWSILRIIRNFLQVGVWGRGRERLNYECRIKKPKRARFTLRLCTLASLRWIQMLPSRSVTVSRTDLERGMARINPAQDVVFRDIRPNFVLIRGNSW